MAWLGFLIDLWLGTNDKEDTWEQQGDVLSDATGTSRPTSTHGPSFLTKKIVTHVASKTYQCAGWKDETTVGLWKRAWSPDLSSPFTKLSLRKVLLLADAKARSDYFTQQTNFVMHEGRKDQYAEFSTNIQVEGFKSKVLAVRPVRGAPSSKLFRLHLFWVFTCLGMTVPYRIWFSNHCDELRVSIIKEAFATAKRPKLSSSSSWSKWFTRSSKGNEDATFSDGASKNSLSADVRNDFRRRMEELAIYQKDEAEETLETAALLQQEIDNELTQQPMQEAQENHAVFQGTFTKSDQKEGLAMERDESLVSNMTHPLNSHNESAVDDESSIATIVQNKKNAAVVSKNVTAATGNTSTSVSSPYTKGNEGSNGNTTASKY